MKKYTILLLLILAFTAYSKTLALEKFSMKRRHLNVSLRKSHVSMGINLVQTDSILNETSKLYYGINFEYSKILSQNRIHRVNLKCATAFGKSKTYTFFLAGYKPSFMLPNYSELGVFMGAGSTMRLESNIDTSTTLTWLPTYSVSISYLLPSVNKRIFIEKDVNYQIEFAIIATKDIVYRYFKELSLKIYF